MRSYLASRVVADNTEMLDKFFNRLGLSKKVRYIPHGLPLNQYKPLSVPKPGYRERLQIPPDAPLLGCVAQLVPVKDHPTLLRAIARVPDAHLLLAGSTTDSDYQNYLNNLSSDLNISTRVHFLGNIQNIPEFLAELDIFILPTMEKGEGMGVALLEASACGKACIGTNVTGIRDIIINGETGILVPPSDSQALADSISALVASPEERKRLGTNARKRVEQNFSIEREVKAHEALYEEILGRE